MFANSPLKRKLKKVVQVGTFRNLRNLLELQKGFELALTSSLFGIPEILVVHIKYDDYVFKSLTDLAQYKLRIRVIVLDPDSCCEDCTGSLIKHMIDREFPGAQSLVNVKYFGISQEYIDMVAEKVNELSS